MAGNIKEKTTSIVKKAKIDKAQRNMFIAVSIASIVLGITFVGVMYLIKVISFNAKVSAEKDTIISEYKSVQGVLDELSSNVSELSKNERLEVVARERSDTCKNVNLDLISNSDEGIENIELTRTCSALRVIPDALPSVYNEDSIMMSMIGLLRRSNGNQGVNTESVNGGAEVSTEESGNEEDLSNVFMVGTSISLEDDSSKVKNAMSTIEGSIRNYDIQSATITWSDGKLKLNALYASYYSKAASIVTSKKIICANNSNDVCTKAINDAATGEDDSSDD